MNGKTKRQRAVERPGERLVRKGDYIGGCFFKPESVNGYINESIWGP